MFVRSLAAGVAVGIVLSATGAARAGVVGAFEVVVPGRANIFGAGLDSAPAPGGGGGGLLPVEVLLPAVQSGAYFSVSAAFGSVSCCGDGPFFNGPDGGNFASGTTNVNSFGAISGIIHSGRSMFLVGVFTGNAEPGNGAPTAPPRLDFSNGGDEFHELSPLLNQTFFIGDGLTEEDHERHQVSQKFLIPDGATRLWLGFADAFNFDGDPGYYDDNFGEITVVGGFVPAPGVAGLLMAGAVSALRRRRV